MTLDINKQKTIGIIGGMGPYATLDFLKNILDSTPAQKDWDHFRIIIDNNPKIPSRTRAFLFDEEDPVPMMVKSAEFLQQAGADFAVIPCNSAHYFLPRVLEETSLPFINLIDEVCKAIFLDNSRKIGLLGGEVTVKGRLYEERLEKYGVTVLQVSDEEQVLVREVIEDGKKNQVNAETCFKVQGLINSLEARGVESIVLGCTELPMAMADVNTRCKIVDSVDVLAKSVVRFAMGLDDSVQV